MIRYHLAIDTKPKTGNVYDVYSSGTSTTFTYTLAAGTYTIKGMTGSSTGGTYSGTAKASESISRPVRIMSVTVVNAE